MDSIGAFLNEEWESLNKMFSNEDTSNFLGNFDVVDLFQCDQNVPGIDESMFFPSNTNGSNLYCMSHESGESSEFNTPPFTNQSPDTFESMDFINMDCSNVSDVFPDEMMEEILQLKADICNEQVSNAKILPTETDDSSKAMQLKRKYETQTHGNDEEESSENPKKKPRAPRNAQKNKKNAQSRKSKAKQVSNKEEEEKSGTCSSEEGSNDSESKDTINSKGKERATRGSATDPQSLYARRRREKINERLRTLQNLVPNGTKVDISTMLEEAGHYVKFLQMQIKLLSSDDTWMYAPIAYNGMDFGFYQKMFFPRA